MNIAIESSLAASLNPTGLGVYVDSLLTALASGPDSGQHTFFLLHAQEKWHGKEYGKHFIPVSYHFTNSQFLAISFRLNTVLKNIRADLFHATCNSGVPPFCRVPAVTTIHDIFPQTSGGTSWKFRILMKLLFHWVESGSAHIICNSNFTKNDLLTHGFRRLPMTVISLGSQFEFGNYHCITHAVGNSFLLCVGALEERKGQLMLCEAYRKALERNPHLPDLVFVGPDRGSGRAMREQIARTGKIKWLDYVDKNELYSLYRAAGLFVFPSSFEGFGIPVIEAMQAGVPVVCSDIPVLREVTGGHAVCVPPRPDAFCDAILAVYGTSSGEKLDDARKWADQFSWRNHAAETMKIYHEIGKKNHGPHHVKNG